jgi:thymidylate synthase ThyX
MKVTLVSIRPSEASNIAGRPSLTPELLAASGARYSRNNEGLESILSRIDQNNLDRSVDSIFKMIDYGHQSIADMVPVAMFIDGISIWLAYYIWSLSPMAGGQESSTRYIKLSSEGLIDPHNLGIDTGRLGDWDQHVNQCFQAYQENIFTWEKLIEENHELIHYPQSLTGEQSEKNKKQIERMKRNYAFDRSRYYLPVSAATNVMLIMSARNWVQLCQHLLAHMLPEAKQLGESIRNELKLTAPRLIKYAERLDYMVEGISAEFLSLQKTAQINHYDCLENNFLECTHLATPNLETDSPRELSQDIIKMDLLHHPNRYAWIGENLRRIIVRFSWDAVAFAEIRDLNRHRTGNKYCQLIPCGFYFASDQLPDLSFDRRDMYFKRSRIGRDASLAGLELLRKGDPSYIYWTLLGTQYKFEHVTTADKFIYEAELRTGIGAHYRYASHLRDALSLWYDHYPLTKGLVIEGSAEPE